MNQQYNVEHLERVHTKTMQKMNFQMHLFRTRENAWYNIKEDWANDPVPFRNAQMEEPTVHMPGIPSNRWQDSLFGENCRYRSPYPLPLPLPFYKYVSDSMSPA